MDRDSIRHFLLLVVLLTPTVAPSGHAVAAPSDRRTLVLRGRVTDAKGWPVAGARVVSEGSRRLRATADDAGQYTLNLALGSGADLARQPVSVRARAERRGWRFALASGEVEMGLDLRVVAGSGGAARCEVRSNQAAVGSAVVRALTADGDATVVANVNFLGVEGEEIGSPPALDLPLVETVTLAGVHLPSPPPAPVAAAPVPRAPERKSHGGPAGERAGSAAEKPMAGEAEKPARPTAKAGPDTARAIASAKPGARAEKDLAKRAREEQKAREKEEARARRVAAEAAERAREAEEKRSDSLRRDVRLAAGAADTASPLPAKSLDRLAGPPARPQHRSRTPAPAPLVQRRDTIAVRPPRDLPAPTPDPVSGPVGATASGRSPVRPKPDGEPRVRSAPFVIRAPGPKPPAPGDSCACRIEGTVEVDWDRPLPARTRVVVSLIGHPAIADTVELFMGSPRGFALPAAPCGPHRLRLVNLGSLRFDVISREAMAGFRCESGTRRQFRIVLRPR